MTKDYSTWTESRREKSLEAMALKWSQMKFPSRSPLTPTERITSLDVLSRNPLPSSDQFWVIPERHSIPIFRRTVHQIALRKLEWFDPTQHMTHADEKRWDASDIDGLHTHMAYGARRRDETQWHHQTSPPEWVTELSHATRTPNLE